MFWSFLFVSVLGILLQYRTSSKDRRTAAAETEDPP